MRSLSSTNAVGGKEERALLRTRDVPFILSMGAMPERVSFLRLAKIVVKKSPMFYNFKCSSQNYKYRQIFVREYTLISSLSKYFNFVNIRIRFEVFF
jgi:hypothetical protein